MFAEGWHISGNGWGRRQLFLQVKVMLRDGERDGEKEGREGGKGEGRGETRNLINRRCGDPDGQASAADGRDDLTGGVAAEDQPAGGHVLLHGSPEGVLGIFSQSVHFRQQNNC